MKNDNIRYEVMSQGYLKEVAECHRKAFPRQFLSRMGISTLNGLYRAYLDSKEVFFAAINEDQIIGFVSGGNEQVLIDYRKIIVKQSPIKFIFSLFSLDVITSGLYLVTRYLFKLLHPHKKLIHSPIGYYYLSVIAIDEKFRGHNISKNLIDLFEIECKSRGYKGYYLHVSMHNLRAISFYKKQNMLVYNFDNKTDLTMIKHFI